QARGVAPAPHCKVCLTPYPRKQENKDNKRQEGNLFHLIVIVALIIWSVPTVIPNVVHPTMIYYSINLDLPIPHIDVYLQESTQFSCKLQREVLSELVELNVEEVVHL